jgi:hypothetical protein
MTVVMDQRLTVSFSGGVPGVDPGMDETDDIVMKYIEQWDDTNKPTLHALNDPCSMGLLKMARSARPDAVTVELTR